MKLLSALVALLVGAVLWDRLDRWVHREHPGPPARKVSPDHPVFRGIQDPWGRGVIPDRQVNLVPRAG